MFWEGRCHTVSRVIREAITGEPLANIRLRPGCATPCCVQPNHALVENLYGIDAALAEGLVAVPPEEEEDSLDDVITTVYEQPQPWNAEGIAEMSRYPLNLVREAIRMIEAGEA